MDAHLIKRILGAIIILLAIGGGIYILFKKKEENIKITYSTSDAKNLKGDTSIALDSWIGYFPFRSPVFGKLMRDSGYRVKILDDNANYEKRMKLLKKGKIDFAVCTVDSYLLNGMPEKFPGIIIAIIDESKGGDAIVSWKNKIANIDDLKSGKEFSVAFTPASPSEHLMKAIGVHFDVLKFKEKEGDWRIEVNGAEEAYKLFIQREADIAVIWEPHVTEALAIPGVTKLIGSEDIQNLIVDILLVNREFSEKNPALVKIFLKNYFETLNIYRGSDERLNSDIIDIVELAPKQVRSMLDGVKWITYPENLQWFGVNYTGFEQPQLIDSINSTIKILIENNDFEKNPLVDNDPYTILNSSFLKDLYVMSGTGVVPRLDSLTRRFPKLTPEQWKRLSVVGKLRLRPITFRSGTSTIDENGRRQVKIIVNNVRHYPNFRILIKGHTGLRGDPKANMELSLGRAEAVKNELQYTYDIDPNRMLVKGIGSREPLPKESGESDRSYNNRLKRVEILFLTSK